MVKLYGHSFSVRDASCRACVLGVALILSCDIQGGAPGRHYRIAAMHTYVARAGRTAVVIRGVIHTSKYDVCFSCGALPVVVVLCCLFFSGNIEGGQQGLRRSLVI